MEKTKWIRLNDILHFGDSEFNKLKDVFNAYMEEIEDTYTFARYKSTGISIMIKTTDRSVRLIINSKDRYLIKTKNRVRITIWASNGSVIKSDKIFADLHVKSVDIMKLPDYTEISFNIY